MSEELKYKMHHYEVAPPGAVWDAIDQELAGQRSFAPLSQKLYHYEEVPPASAWAAIESGLTSPEKKAPVKPINTLKNFRWIAAAVLTGILLVSSYYFLNNSDRVSNYAIGNNTTSPQPDEQKQSSSNPYVTAPTPRASFSGQRTLASSYTYSSKKNYAVNSGRPLHSAQVEETEPMDEQTIYIPATPIRNEAGEVIQDMGLVNPYNNKYISVTAPNGEQTKISSKLASAMVYLNEDDQSMDNNTWAARIREWRVKIMQSSFVPSSNNFLDILEFSELIEVEE